MARISVRKMGTRGGQPHYGATCNTCGSVIVSAHVSKETAKEMSKAHTCSITLRWAQNGGI